MHMGRFIRSDIRRTTLTQELQIILPPLAEDVRDVRRVQLVVPASPAIFAVVDPDDADLNMNRSYMVPQMHPGQVIQFSLAPHQRLAAMASVGVANLSIVVETFAPEA